MSDAPIPPLADQVQQHERDLIDELEHWLQIPPEAILADCPCVPGADAHLRVRTYMRALAAFRRGIAAQHRLRRLAQRHRLQGILYYWGDEPPVVTFAPAPPPPTGCPSNPKLRDGTPVIEAIRRQIALLRSELTRRYTAPLDALLP